MKQLLVIALLSSLVSCKCNSSSDNGKGGDPEVIMPESEITWTKYMELYRLYRRSMDSAQLYDPGNLVEYRNSLLKQINAISITMKRRGIDKPDSIGRLAF